nr:hypothetical protein [Sphingobium sp. Leaf26]
MRVEQAQHQVEARGLERRQIALRRVRSACSPEPEAGMRCGAQSLIEQRIVRQMERRAEFALRAAQPQADRASACKQDGMGAVLGLTKLLEARQRFDHREIRPWVDDHDACGCRRIPQRGLRLGR